MALPLPNGLSPSKVDSVQSCPMAFRFSVIDRVPERPAVWTTKGTLVHRALELLHMLDGPDRSVEAALDALDRAITEMGTDPDWPGLDLDDAGRQQLCDDAVLRGRLAVGPDVGPEVEVLADRHAREAAPTLR